ncbi:MAG: glycoside hydrolase [Alphaproteobacteria bacterium]
MAVMAGLVWCAPMALADDNRGEHESHKGRGGTVGTCPAAAVPAPRCANTVAAAFGPDGRPVLAWAQRGHLYVARADERGAVTLPPTRVNAEAASIDDSGEGRPRVVEAGPGRILVSYVVRGETSTSGTLMFSRSEDDGRTFTMPVRLSDEANPVSQRFAALTASADGRVVAAWLDKRDAAAAWFEGARSGAAVYYALSTDGGRTFSPNTRLLDRTCECCRLGLALGDDGQSVVMWRNIFGRNIRDHALATIGRDGAAGPVHRVSEDNWAVDSCPHHGPALSVAASGVYDAVWFTGVKARRGVYHARTTDGGRTFSAPLRLGGPDTPTSHPQVVSRGDSVVVAWKELLGDHVEIRSMTSSDGARTWSTPKRLAETNGASDHPQLLTDGQRVFLSWLTAAEGYRLLPVDQP